MYRVANAVSKLGKMDSVSLFFLILWLATMISIPIQRWVWGEEAILRGTVIGVLLQAITVLMLLRRVWGIRRIAAVSLGIVIFAWLIEWIGSSTGIPFGHYDYTDRLQPQLAGVPLLIPFAWLMMVPPSWAVASYIVEKCAVKKWPRLWFIGISALAFTAWDLFLDPQMVHWNLWVWEQPGGYFGIPWVNFAGWFLAIALLTALVRPATLSDVALAAVYTLTWMLESIALIFFWNLPGPGAVGFIVMGAFAVFSWYRISE